MAVPEKATPPEKVPNVAHVKGSAAESPLPVGVIQLPTFPLLSVSVQLNIMPVCVGLLQVTVVSAFVVALDFVSGVMLANAQLPQRHPKPCRCKARHRCRCRSTLRNFRQHRSIEAPCHN